jgi:hypothetical protein
MDVHGSHSSPQDFTHVTRQAASRLKLARVKVAVSRFVVVLATVEGVWALVLLDKRSWIAPFPWVMAGALALLLLIAVLGWLRRADPKAIHRGIDRRLHLPDLALSAGELSGEDDWSERLREQALARTGLVDWRQAWPVPWPQWTRRATFSCVALFSLLGYCYQADLETQRVAAAHPAPRDPRAVALEELFKDWEQAKPKDEELKKMLEKIAPLRDRLTAPHANEKQQFADMVRLEEIVAAEKAMRCNRWRGWGRSPPLFARRISRKPPISPVKPPRNWGRKKRNSPRARRRPETPRNSLPSNSAKTGR